MDQNRSQGTSNRQYKRPTLKIHEQKGTLTIQTQDLALQVIFNSPILQFANYIQQVQKYCLRGALSGINLKQDQYDAYYTKIKEKIDQAYNTLTYKTMPMIQELLVSLRLLKIQMWRQQTAIANALRTHLYHKNLDPYGFDPAQFDADINSILNTKASLQEGLIQQLSSKLKQHQAQKMDEMFCGKVLNPYIAQNRDRNQVNPSSLYASLINNIKAKVDKHDDTLMKRHSNIQEQIFRFMQFITDHNLKAQKITHTLIKRQLFYIIQVFSRVYRYNDFSSEGNDFLLTSIAPNIQIIQKKETIDADELYTAKQFRSDLKPAFANRINNVKFKQEHKLFDPESGNLVQIQIKEIEETHRQWDRHGSIQPPSVKVSPFDSFAERKRNNPKEFYQPRDPQKHRYRQDEQTRMRERDRNEKQREKQKFLARRIVKISILPPNWGEISDHEYSFYHFYSSRKQKEIAYWDIKQRQGQMGDETAYYVKWQKSAQSPLFRSTEQKSRYEQELKKEQELAMINQEQASIVYQSRRRQEESSRLVKLKRLTDDRTYQKFMAMNKLEIRQPPFCDTRAVNRYGIIFNVNFERSKELKEVDRFFYYYFKERYYKENQYVKQNADNPIIYLDSSKYNMQSSAKTVSQYVGSIVKKIQSLPFFMIWSEDLLIYRLKTFKDKKIGNFQFYPYVSLSNSQKLMYEIRRRVHMTVKEQIKQKYCKSNEIERIYSKVQIAHRALFDRHKEMVDLSYSVLKGKQIVNEIFQSLRRV